MKNTKQKVSMIVVLLAAFLTVAANTATGQVIYDSTVSPLPGNLPSEGAEAYAFNEFGDGIIFAGSARSLGNVTVTMSSWGCQAGTWHTNDCVTTPGATFSIPITLNIYNAGSPTPGSLIATRTQTFTIPYRPSADHINCTLANAGKWYQASSGTCFNGLANNITFDLTSLNVVLPNSVVYGIVYNTTSFGPSPIGTLAACFSTSAGCPYDSLNIALAPVVTVGTKPFFNTIYQNSPYGFEYCDNGTAGVGTFRLDSPTNACWAGYVPAARFNALTREQCQDSLEQKEKAFEKQQNADKKAFDAQPHTKLEKKAFEEQQEAAEKAFNKQNEADEKRCDQLPKGDKDDKDDKKDKDDKDGKHDH
jgi:hypothetical protein